MSLFQLHFTPAIKIVWLSLKSLVLLISLVLLSTATLVVVTHCLLGMLLSGVPVDVVIFVEIVIISAASILTPAIRGSGASGAHRRIAISVGIGLVALVGSQGFVNVPVLLGDGAAFALVSRRMRMRSIISNILSFMVGVRVGARVETLLYVSVYPTSAHIDEALRR